MAENGKLDPVQVCTQHSRKIATYKDVTPEGKEVYSIYQRKDGKYNILDKSYDKSGKLTDTICHESGKNGKGPMVYEKNPAFGNKTVSYPDTINYIPKMLEYLKNKI